MNFKSREFFRCSVRNTKEGGRPVLLIQTDSYNAVTFVQTYRQISRQEGTTKFSYRQYIPSSGNNVPPAHSLVDYNVCTQLQTRDSCTPTGCV